LGENLRILPKDPEVLSDGSLHTGPRVPWQHTLGTSACQFLVDTVVFVSFYKQGSYKKESSGHISNDQDDGYGT